MVRLLKGTSLLACMLALPLWASIQLAHSQTPHFEPPVQVDVILPKAHVLPSRPVRDDPAAAAPLGPSSTAAVGVTAGSFAVNADGAATYSIPIVVPPGRRGLEPSLALAYDSQGGDGPAGVGFGLVGASSAISRCGRNASIDGRMTAVQWTADDALCLDGSRLMLKSGSYHAASAEYRKERDDFSG